jgi:deoxyribodipyrimidine photo-lyase
MPSRAVVWFRRDLRVADHPALLAALDAADQVVPTFVVDRPLLEGRPSGPNRRAFLHGALRSLARDLEALGGRLRILEGDPVTVIPALARELAATTVWCSREHTPYARRRDTAVERALRADGRSLHPMPGLYLSDFDELRTADGDPFRVYSPFARAAKTAAWDDPLPAPTRVPVPADFGPGDPGPWPAGFGLEGAVEITPPDPGAALERLRWFTDRRVDRYARARNYMAVDGTSRLSPYLRFGLVSPRQVAAAVGRGGRAAEHPRRAGDRETFVNELLWRDFYGYVLYHQPESAWEHMRPEFARFEFEDDPDGLAAWQEGRTGYPLVDAGMRQLTGQGWVHNRARMVVASFLTKHLLVDWREGARFFLQHLMDGDLPANNGGWQWVAGTGTDAAPYHRIFNPVTQAEKFDPDGDYIRRWVPELAKLQPPAIFAPWQASPADLEAGGVRLGTDYPHPIVDHMAARNRALARHGQARRGEAS